MPRRLAPDQPITCGPLRAKLDTPQSAADQHGEHGVIAQVTERRGSIVVEQAASLLGG